MTHTSGRWASAKSWWAGRRAAWAGARLMGYALVAVGTLGLAGGLVITKLALRSVNNETFNSITFSFATLFMVVYLLAQGRGAELRIRRADWGPVAFLMVGSAITITSWTYAIRLSDAVVVSFFMRLEVIATVLAAVLFLQERLSRQEVVGMVVALVGAGVLTYASGRVGFLALALVVVGAVSHAVTWLAIRSSQRRGYSSEALACLRNGGAATVMALAALLLGRWEPVSWGIFALMPLSAFCGPFLGLWMLYRALPLIGVARLGVMGSLQPLFVIPVALLVLGTLPSLRQLLGGAIVFAGILLIVTATGQAGGKPE